MNGREGKGAFGKAGGIPRSWGEARYARMRRCLILRQGASPLRPRIFRLTGSGLLMEAATVRERWLSTWPEDAPDPEGTPVAALIGGTLVGDRGASPFGHRNAK